MKIPEDEQIKSVLSRKIQDLIKKYMDPETSVTAYKFSDVITVNKDDIFEWVVENGFPERIVASEQKEDRICLVPSGKDFWQVFYLERGQKSHEKTYENKSDAIRNIIELIYTSVKIHQNSMYKHAHPELNLPSILLID